MASESLPAKSDSTAITLYDEFQFVLASYALISPYKDALDNYCRATHYPVSALPPCLCDPLLFFYTRKHTKFLFYTDGFRFAGTISYRVTHRTFPSLLRDLGFAEGPIDLRHCLLEELDKLVRKFPYTEREAMCKKAFKLDHDYTAYIEKNLRVSSCKNLYVPQLSNVHSGGVALFPYSTILSPRFKRPSAFSRSFMRQHLSSIVRDPKANAVNDYVFPDDCLIFANDSVSSGSSFHILTPQSAPMFQSVETPLLLPTKMLFFDVLPPKIPAGAVAWLFQLTGGNLDLLDQLAALLARAASPASSKKVSVLCSTQNLDILLDFLCAVLYPLVSPDMHAQLHSPKSLNNYCRVSGLQRLFIDQESGAGVFFANDTAVSDSARPILKKLLSGHPISISVPGFPKQTLCNRNHIIVVSSNPEKAARLSKALKVPFLDFSKYELPVNLPVSDLSDEDLNWLRCAFLPYGLVDKPQQSNRIKFPSVSWVEDFLKDCCALQSGTLCDRHDFYADYCACYTARFPGKQPPLTLGRFCKVAKDLLDKGIYRGASYHKVRTDQKMYFDGIVCIKDPSDIRPDPQATLLGRFKIHIKQIDALRPVWHANNSVSLLPKPKDALPEETEEHNGH